MQYKREEAMQYKYILEKMRQSRDYSSSKKIAPDLENISQMLVVCEVLSASEAKVNGYHDWYGILKVDPKVDESVIKKRYRKLALLLHPDKNKFLGAESAFKLVGEAHRVLTNRAKRSAYDKRRKMAPGAVRVDQPPQESKNPSSVPFKAQKRENEIKEEMKLQKAFEEKNLVIRLSQWRRNMLLELSDSDSTECEDNHSAEKQGIIDSKNHDNIEDCILSGSDDQTHNRASKLESIKRGRIIDVEDDLPEGDSVGGKRSKASRERDLNNLNSSCPRVVEYHDSEFYDFELERCKGKLKSGQIWAVFYELDGFPKYYAMIRSVDLESFKVHVTWLEPCQLSEGDRRWSDDDLPIPCGRFKLSGREGHEEYDTCWVFSHLVSPVCIEDDHHLYDIYPRVNEVWALYKTWDPSWRMSDVERCSREDRYEVVEILSRDASAIIVGMLEKIGGFRSVFRRRRFDKDLDEMEVPWNELLRFSHQIPSFRLTDERGGELRGSWELDPASLPRSFLSEI